MDNRTNIEKAVLEKKFNVKPGMLELYELHLAALCHRKYLAAKMGVKK